MTSAAVILLALALDALIGWPNWLFARIGHPVTWIGALIGALDRRLNGEGQGGRIAGTVAALSVIALAAAIGAVVQAILPEGRAGLVLGAVIAGPLLAMRSLHEHVAAVVRPLLAGDLPGARQAVAQIVGRDPARLDAAGVARAGLESLAENASDGIVAPVFWGVVGGLPGLAAYKAINTLDSMIGHMTPRHRRFGWAAARIDDLANWIPARLTGALFALVSSRPVTALDCMRRDARAHRSPNAGWPEAAMAGALAIRLSGPRVYGARVSDEPWLNGAARDPGARDLARGLALYRRAMAAMAAILFLLAVL